MLNRLTQGRCREELFLASVALFFLPLAAAQNNSKPADAPAPVPFAEWATKSFDLKYADPEQLRAIFSDRSFVIEANRDLRTLTAHGTPAFLREVEDTVKRFDVPPPLPANLEITVYLLTVAAQAPSGGPLPPELAALAKGIAGAGGQALRLADSQMMRLREGQPGETSGAATPDSSSLSRVRLKDASTVQGPKGEMIALNGLQVWLSIPAPAGTNGGHGNGDADVSANIDVDANQVVIVYKAGVDKPVVVVVRAAVAR